MFKSKITKFDQKKKVFESVLFMDQTKLEVLRRRGENNYMDDEVRTQIYIQQYKFVSK